MILPILLWNFTELCSPWAATVWAGLLGFPAPRCWVFMALSRSGGFSSFSFGNFSSIISFFYSFSSETPLLRLPGLVLHVSGHVNLSNLCILCNFLIDFPDGVHSSQTFSSVFSCVPRLFSASSCWMHFWFPTPLLFRFTEPRTTSSWHFLWPCWFNLWPASQLCFLLAELGALPLLWVFFTCHMTPGICLSLSLKSFWPVGGGCF